MDVQLGVRCSTLPVGKILQHPCVVTVGHQA